MTSSKDKWKDSIPSDKTEKKIVRCPNCGTHLNAEKHNYVISSEWFFWNMRSTMITDEKKNSKPKPEPVKYIEVENPIWKVESCLKCEKIKNTEEKMIAAGINKGYVKKRFCNYQIYNDNKIAEMQKSKIDYFKTIAETWKDKRITPIIVIYGNTGTGKGHMVTAFIYELIYRYNIKARFVKYNSLMKEIQDSYDSEEVTEKQILNHYKTADLTVLDEIGIVEKNSNWAFNILYDIIDYRYENGKPTIIISNLGEQKLPDYFKKFNERLYSRVFAKSNQAMFFNWEDYRIGGIK
jgi:DNA replication protein DnaC